MGRGKSQRRKSNSTAEDKTDANMRVTRAQGIDHQTPSCSCSFPPSSGALRVLLSPSAIFTFQRNFLVYAIFLTNIWC